MMELLIVFVIIVTPIVAVCWLVFRAIDSIGKDISMCITATQHRKTTQHYFDRDDVYLDYEQNQWFYKPGYPKEASE